MNTQTTQIQYQ